MILGYAIRDGRLVVLDDPLAAVAELAWLDLVSPSAAEEAAVEAALSVDVPTREEMQEIEISSRLYHNEGVVFMTASVPVRSDSDNPVAAPITFMLAGSRLITVRYAEPTAITAFQTHAARAQLGCHEGDTILIGLLEAIIDRLADILEKTGAGVSGQTEVIFAVDERKPRHPEEFRRLLRDLGRAGDLISQVQESLVGLQRMFAFLQNTTRAAERSADTRSRIKTLSRDAISLAVYADSLNAKVIFLLEATLGMITIEQNQSIKIFSVVAVIFLPPTLIASIYGMNFHVMPELSWPWGYPLALALMAGSVLFTYRFFRRRGWL